MPRTAPDGRWAASDSVIPRFPYYIFDVDGTLLDSAADICAAIQQALADRASRIVSEDSLRRLVGLSLAETFRSVIPACTIEQIDDLTQGYKANYLARVHGATSVYPGVKETLSLLAGRKATATTKKTPTTRAALEHFDLIQYFDHVQGTDGFPCKPAPDVIFASLRGLNAPLEDCLFIGDSTADMEAGRRAGVKICAVRYGYGDEEELARWKPDYWLSDFRELLT